MRTEEIIKEAKGFSREQSAYIHAEMLDGRRGTVIVCGDNVGIVVTLYEIIEAFAETNLPENASFRDLGKEIRKCFKALKKLHRLSRAVGEPMFEKKEVDDGESNTETL